jgi:hypothetical protein
MFGFINVLLAAAFARSGADEGDIANLLEVRDANSIDFRGDGVQWRGREVGAADLGEARATLALSFGSCSFREPMDELGALGLL